MYYIMENIHVNPDENLFFGLDDATPEQRNTFFGPIIKKHISKGSFSADQNGPEREMRVDQLPTGEWQRTIYTKFFTSPDAVAEWFHDITEPGSEYRTLLKAWHNEHKILNETNILDENYQLVKTINSCQGNMCRHYGQCAPSGCDIVPKRDPSGAYPVYHLSTTL